MSNFNQNKLNKAILWSYRGRGGYLIREFFRMVLHVELPINCEKWKRSLCLPHPFNVIVNQDAMIGENTTFFDR